MTVLVRLLLSSFLMVAVASPALAQFSPGEALSNVGLFGTPDDSKLSQSDQPLLQPLPPSGSRPLPQHHRQSAPPAQAERPAPPSGGQSTTSQPIGQAPPPPPAAAQA